MIIFENTPDPYRHRLENGDLVGRVAILRHQLETIHCELGIISRMRDAAEARQRTDNLRQWAADAIELLTLPTDPRSDYRGR